MTCCHRWVSTRVMTNTNGEQFESMPVNHVCARGLDHEPPCACSCGAVRTNDDWERQRNEWTATHVDD